MKRKLNVILLTVMSAIFTSQISAQVPYGLSSFPSAAPTIFIDFDGQTVESPYWNGGNPIYCAATTMTNAQMIRVFNQVAEDYRPFNLNVTTDSAVYLAAPVNRRTRIIVTPTSAWYGSSGGVAYIESFRWGLELPAFVFSALLGNSDKRVSEATSHEAGHTLGLYHQALYNSSCGFLNEYNPGTGTDFTETSWAPIMGNSYRKNLSLWHRGTSSLTCSHIQDDLSIIANAANGVTLRTDDYGNTRNTAATVNFSGNDYAISGSILQTGDLDYVKLNLDKDGRLLVNANPFKVNETSLNSANIDLEVDIENANGTIIASYNPTSLLKASIDTNLTAGIYYLKVKAGANPNTTNYGMLGNYNIVGSFTANSSLPVYSLVLNGNNNKGKHELSWNIVADEALESVTIETSENGTDFTRMQNVNSDSRSFSYQPMTSGNRFYRLHVVTASQLEYYSNIITIKSSSDNVKFNILNNRISGNEIVVHSKGNYNYRLLDMGGRNIQSGRMNIGFNRISAPTVKSGMYLIQIIDGTEVTTERLMVQ